MSSNIQCDVAVLGGGPGGYVAAMRAAQRGAKVALVEAAALGGTCLNTGCIPSKAMLHASEMCWEAARAAEFGLRGGPMTADGPAFMGRVIKTVSILRKGLESLLKARRVEVIRGRGKLLGRDAIGVQTADGQVEIRARAIILATGSRPARPGVFPWSDPRVQTTDEVTIAADLPASVLIVGGGVIGCEMATVHAELGIPTTVIELMDRLVPALETEVSQAVARSLQKRSAGVLTGARVVEAVGEADGVSVRLEGGQAFKADRVIVAVGRKANVEQIGLEEVGVRVQDGIVPVDDACRTNIENIYAIGDLAEKKQYAHLAHRMGQVAADNATGHAARDDRTVVPVGMYTHPEVATVGLSEAEARQAGLDVRVSSFPFQAGGMARAHGLTEGSVKLVGSPDGRLVGATIIGARATDVIQEIALAMRHGLSVGDLAETIHSHPTFVEAIHESAESWLGLPVHTLR